MRAVKDINNHISFINSLETKLYELANADKLCASELSERDVHVCEELYKRNIFHKHAKGNEIFYVVAKRPQV